MVCVESGALSYYMGDIKVYSQLMPSFGGLLSSLFADEAVYRPTYTGTGAITLESSLGGFYELNLQGDSWILEPGSYWASEGSINVSFQREKIITSIWAGEGPLYLQTKVRGQGKVILATRGPVEEFMLSEGQSVATEGKYVIARTGDVSFKVQRTTQNYFGRFTSGEGLVRVYSGTGRILVNPAPYWRYRVSAERSGQSNDSPSRTTI